MDSNSHPQTGFGRPAQVAAFLGVANSTLWHWVKTRDGFPQPFKLGPNVTAFDWRQVQAYAERLKAA